MTTPEIPQTVAALAARLNGKPIPEHHWDLPLEELDFDSLDLVKLLLELEEHFRIKIPDADVPALASIRSIAVYIADKTARR